MMRWLISLVLTMLPSFAIADEESVRRAIDIVVPPDQRMEREIVFAEGLQKITLVVNKRLAREPKLPVDEARYQKYYDDAGVYMTYPLDVKLQAEDPKYFVLRCNSGGDDDPSCVFSTSQDPAQPGISIPGTLFVISGNGCVYSASHIENKFHPMALHCLAEGDMKLVPTAMTGVWP